LAGEKRKWVSSVYLQLARKKNQEGKNWTTSLEEKTSRKEQNKENKNELALCPDWEKKLLENSVINNN